MRAISFMVTSLLLLAVLLCPKSFAFHDDFRRGEQTQPRAAAVQLYFFAARLAAPLLIAQAEQKQEEKKATPAPIAPAARLASAKTALLRKTGNGTNIAYDVVSSTLDGWGRFTLVHELDKADVIVEVYSVEESGGGISASAGPRGRGRSTSSSVNALIKLTVYDAKTHIALWTGAEHPKGAMKKVDRENNEVEAAQRLVNKFHDTLEPPPKQ